MVVPSPRNVRTISPDFSIEINNQTPMQGSVRSNDRVHAPALQARQPTLALFTSIPRPFTRLYRFQLTGVSLTEEVPVIKRLLGWLVLGSGLALAPALVVAQAK